MLVIPTTAPGRALAIALAGRFFPVGMGVISTKVCNVLWLRRNDYSYLLLTVIKTQTDACEGVTFLNCLFLNKMSLLHFWPPEVEPYRMFFCICGAPNLEPLLRGLYCCDALLSLQKAGLLPGAPSRDFLKGVKAKKTSYVEVLIARRKLRDYLLDLVPEGEQQTMRDLFLLVSKSLTAFPLEGVPLTAPSLVLAEMLRDLHNGSFDPTLRTFLSDYPGGLEESGFWV